MQAIDFVAETLTHFVKQSDGPSPGIPVHTDPDLERELTWLCEWHGLTPIILWSLEKLALRPQISRIGLERIRALAGASRGLTAEQLKTATSLSSIFDSEKIDYLILGDTFLAAAIYHDPALRPVREIELLIREKDWVSVVAVSLKKGFSLRRRLPEFRDGAKALEYYQQYPPCVLENERGDRLTLRLRIFDFGDPEATERAWEHGRRISETGPRCVGYEDALIHSCLVHNMTDFCKLLHAIDIGLILTRMGSDLNWEYLRDRVRSKSVYPAVFFTLSTVVRWLELERVSSGWTTPGAVRKRIFDTVWHTNYDGYETRRPKRFHRLRFCLFEAGGWRVKMRFLAGLASPRPEWVAAFFDRPCRPWLKIKFVILTFKDRVGLRLTQNP
jgi:hypothetical protein